MLLRVQNVEQQTCVQLLAIVALYVERYRPVQETNCKM